MTPAPCVRVEAPAKINLGLEILGKRPDGYHEIRSVMTMLKLSDTVHLYVDAAGSGTELPNVPAEENLIARALTAFREAVPTVPVLGWSVEKRIPAAAGLGGASADAAAALVGANTLAGSPLGNEDLARLAASLGSDIPFFLGSSCAIVSGRGTDLTVLPSIDEPVALLIPRVTIADKTRNLYSMIAPADFSDGARSERVVTAIERRHLPDPDDLRNAFERPLSKLVPELRDLIEVLRTSGIRYGALSGAGSAHYVIGPPACEVLASTNVIDMWNGNVDVIWTRTRSTRLRVEPCTDA